MSADLEAGPASTEDRTRRFFPSCAGPKPSPVLIAPTHGGMARLSGPELLG